MAGLMAHHDDERDARSARGSEEMVDVASQPGPVADSGLAARRDEAERRKAGPEHDYHKGAVTLRGKHVPRTTTDQRLLDSNFEADWVHTDPWRVMRIQAEFVEGFGALAELGPAISVFGSARLKSEHPAYAVGEQVGRALVKEGFAVVTGGGPGAMEAANKGAFESGGTSVGLGIELPFETGLNRFVNLGVNFRYFFVRKTVFVKYTQGAIVLPGGVGTLDEMFEAITLVQTQKVTHYPIVLVGTAFWSPLREWLRATVLAEGMISERDVDRMVIVDTAEEAIAFIRDAHRAARAGERPGEA